MKFEERENMNITNLTGRLPEWYSDTGSQFANEQERQQMLAEVEKARAQFSLGEKGEK